MSFVSEHADGVRISVLAVPRASRSEVAGVHDGRLRVRLAAPPVDGAANTQLVRFFADLLGVSKSAVTVAQGSTGRRKTVEVQGIGSDDVRRRVQSPN